MNRIAIVNELTLRGISAVKGTKIVNAVFDLIGEKLADGETVQIIHFGTFKVKPCPARHGWDPYRRQMCDIPAHNKVHFKPAPALKQRIKVSAKRSNAD